MTTEICVMEKYTQYIKQTTAKLIKYIHCYKKKHFKSSQLI